MTLVEKEFSLGSIYPGHTTMAPTMTTVCSAERDFCGQFVLILKL